MRSFVSYKVNPKLKFLLLNREWIATVLLIRAKFYICAKNLLPKR